MLRARLSIAVLTLIAIVSHGSSQGPGIGQQMSAKGQAMRAQGRALGQQQKAAQGQAMGQKMAAQGQQHFSKVT